MVIFFFQAEDGIRDLTVTGVQTCALPILVGLNKIVADMDRMLRRLIGEDIDLVTVLRSEERRVGKECRSRRSPYHLKKTGITGTNEEYRAVPLLDRPFQS